MLDDPKKIDTYVEKMLIGNKMKSIFYQLSYWEHLDIVHLLDPMHILKNILSSLWRNISSRKTNTLVVGRDLIYSNNKKRHSPRKESRREVDSSWYFKEGDVPWILK